MGSLVGGVLVVIAGLVIWSRDAHEWAISTLAFGGYFLFKGIRERRRDQVASRQAAVADDHVPEINERMGRGETPDQIAEAFETQFKIPPVITLQVLATDRVRLMGRGQDAELVAAAMAWIGSGRPETPPPPLEVLAGLNPRRNAFGASGEVQLVPGEGEPGKPVKGGLVATRTHLFFLPLLHPESFAGGAAKEFAMNFFPPIGLVTLAGELAEGVHSDLTGITPKAIAELTERFERPGSFAVPWREIQSVGKETVEGLGPPRVQLAIAHGDPAAPTERRFSKGFGQDEAWVDDWVDWIRMMGVLDGVLLTL